MCVKEETVVTVLVKRIYMKNSPRSALEVYYEMPIFILKDIMENVVQSVARKNLGVPLPVVRTWNLYRGGF